MLSLTKLYTSGDPIKNDDITLPLCVFFSELFTAPDLIN